MEEVFPTNTKMGHSDLNRLETSLLSPSGNEPYRVMDKLISNDQALRKSDGSGELRPRIQRYKNVSLMSFLPPAWCHPLTIT
jgi:hypothetical protein